MFCVCRVRGLLLSPARCVRKWGQSGRAQPASPISPGKTAKKPVDWLSDAATYRDTHSIISDPWSTGPYPEKDLQRVVLDANRDARLKSRSQSGSNEDDRIRALAFEHIPIEDQRVLLFPGQGSQHVGMGGMLRDCPEAMRLFEAASETLGYDLLDVCLNGPKSKLDETVFCQPAVFVCSLAAMKKLEVENPDVFPSLVTDAAGFSVGEYAALVVADVLTFENALRIVKRRAEAMQECNARVPAGMMTVRVSASSRLSEALEEAERVAHIANYLYCGVRVIGGSEVCLQFLTENAEKYAFQIVKRLPVSGAFHTALMDAAVTPTLDVVRDTPVQSPRITVYSNCTGLPYDRREGKIRELMVRQINSPVKWEQIQQRIFAKRQNPLSMLPLIQGDRYPQYMEVGPGRQLGAMFSQVSKKAFKNFTNYPV